MASSFDLKDRVVELCGFLENHGAVVTRKWWLNNYKELLYHTDDSDWYNTREVNVLYEMNLSGIRTADAVVIVSPKEGTVKFNGANVEVGYALGRGKPVFSYGMLERSGMYYEVIQCLTKEDVMLAMDVLEPEL